MKVSWAESEEVEEKEKGGRWEECFRSAEREASRKRTRTTSGTASREAAAGDSGCRCQRRVDVQRLRRLLLFFVSVRVHFELNF